MRFTANLCPLRSVIIAIIIIVIVIITIIITAGVIIAGYYYYYYWMLYTLAQLTRETRCVHVIMPCAHRYLLQKWRAETPSRVEIYLFI